MGGSHCEAIAVWISDTCAAAGVEERVRTSESERLSDRVRHPQLNRVRGTAGELSG